MSRETILERVKLRTDFENEALIKDFIQTVSDRIRLRLELPLDQAMPKEMESVIAEVVKAMINRYELNHEGVEDEKVDVFSMKFINDLLSPYAEDIALCKKALQKRLDKDYGKNVVRFL